MKGAENKAMEQALRLYLSSEAPLYRHVPTVIAQEAITPTTKFRHAEKTHPYDTHSIRQSKSMATPNLKKGGHTILQK